MSEDFREAPRISMNKLAEWMTAGELRRRSIVRDQIRLNAYKAARYAEGRRIMVTHVTNPASTPRLLNEEALRLRDTVPTFPEGDDRRKWALESARAVESFALMESRLKTKKYLATPGARQGADVSISGLRVIVNPDVLYLERESERCKGAIKLHCGKTYPLDYEGLAYAASIIYAYLKDVGESPVPAACIAVDVLSRKYEQAPRNLKTRLRNLEAACETIVGMWPVYLSALQEAAAADDEDGD